MRFFSLLPSAGQPAAAPLAEVVIVAADADRGDVRPTSGGKPAGSADRAPPGAALLEAPSDGHAARRVARQHGRDSARLTAACVLGDAALGAAAGVAVQALRGCYGGARPPWLLPAGCAAAAGAGLGLVEAQRVGNWVRHRASDTSVAAAHDAYGATVLLAGLRACVYAGLIAVSCRLAASGNAEPAVGIGTQLAVAVGAGLGAAAILALHGAARVDALRRTAASS